MSDSVEVIDSFQLSDAAADELASELSEPFGLLYEMSYGSGYMLVRWPDDE